MKIKHACRNCIYIGATYNDKWEVTLYCGLGHKISKKRCPKKCSHRFDVSDWYESLSNRAYIKAEIHQ